MNPTSSADALSQLQQIQSQSQDPNTILSNQQQQLGVNAAQNTVTGLRGAINNTTKLLSQVAPSVMGRTANSLVTNAQASKQVQNEQAPISANLTQEGTDYNNADQDLQQLQQQAQTAASGIYQGQQDKLSYAQNLYNTLYQKEQDAANQAYQQQQLAEQTREANLKTSSSDSSSGLSSVLGALLGGGQTTASSGKPATQTVQQRVAGENEQQAYNALRDLLSTKNKSTINNTIQAIQKSASNGNAGDKIKLGLIQNQLASQFQPYIVSNNSSLRF